MVNREDCGGNGETYLKYLGAEVLVAGLAQFFFVSLFSKLFIYLFLFFSILFVDVWTLVL